MKNKIIQEGKNLHHLFVKDKDIWLTSEELTDLAYRLRTYAAMKQIDRL